MAFMAHAMRAPLAVVLLLAACAPHGQATPSSADSVQLTPPPSEHSAQVVAAAAPSPPPGPPSEEQATAMIATCCKDLDCHYERGSSYVYWTNLGEKEPSFDCVLRTVQEVPVLQKVGIAWKLGVTGPTMARVVEEVSRVRNVRVLDLDVDDVSLAPLASATALRELRLNAGPATRDFGTLAALPLDVLEIHVRGALAATVREVARATNTTSLLILSHEAADLTPLSAMSRLRTLSLITELDVDLAPLAVVHDLEYLDLTFSRPSKLAGLATLRQVRTLSIIAPGPLSLAPVGRLGDLTSLSLAVEGTSDLSPLGAMTKLRSLTLQMNTVTSIAPLGRLRGLVNVDVCHTAVRDPMPLAASRVEYVSLPRSVPVPLAKALADRLPPNAVSYCDR
jgi:hypothetical protein